MMRMTTMDKRKMALMITPMTTTAKKKKQKKMTTMMMMAIKVTMTIAEVALVAAKVIYMDDTDDNEAG